MSRNFVPVVLAVATGIATSYYTFQPVFRDLEAEKKSGLRLGPGQSHSQSAEQQQPRAASSSLPADTPSSK
ncbi:hypothetical protein BJY00DRAFT_279572 [Aspergillus carlsbadensis]|nr:hypothetical protein BJY00DRAFT_279572 [Aspergillus carlsbadensis]